MLNLKENCNLRLMQGNLLLSGKRKWKYGLEMKTEFADFNEAFRNLENATAR